MELQKTENSRLLPRRFSETKFPAVLLLFIIPSSSGKAGIRRKTASLGTVPTDMQNTYKVCQQYEDKLKAFRYSHLSTENQMTLDSMLLYYHTEKSLGDNYLLQEPLGPSLGIQAQLPVLLAEYAFYEDRDISDYLNLLTTIRPYFQSIIKFEQKKSQAGFFMSDATLDRILAQCSAFIRNQMKIICWIFSAQNFRLRKTFRFRTADSDSYSSESYENGSDSCLSGAYDRSGSSAGHWKKSSRPGVF